MTSLSLFFQTAFDLYWVLPCKNRKRGGQALIYEHQKHKVSHLSTPYPSTKLGPSKTASPFPMSFRDWIKLFSLSPNYCRGEVSLQSWMAKGFCLKVRAGKTWLIQVCVHVNKWTLLFWVYSELPVIGWRLHCYPVLTSLVCASWVCYEHW